MKVILGPSALTGIIRDNSIWSVWRLACRTCGLATHALMVNGATWRPPPRLPYATEGAVFCQHFLSSFPFTGNADVHEWRTSESVKILKECPVDCEVFGHCPYANDMAPMYKSVTAPREGGREGGRQKERERERKAREKREKRENEREK